MDVELDGQGGSTNMHTCKVPSKAWSQICLGRKNMEKNLEWLLLYYIIERLADPY